MYDTHIERNSCQITIIRYHFETVVYLQTQLLQIVSMEIYHLESVVSGDVFVSPIKAANHVDP